MYNGEREVLDLHLGVLSPFVDTFVIVESKLTFSGNPKPLYLFQQERYLKPYWRKMYPYLCTDTYSQQEVENAINNPATGGQPHWVREYLQKEEFHRALNELKPDDDDTIILGDVDEIIDPHFSLESESPVKAKLRVYSYYLDNRSSEEFYGTTIAQYKDIKRKSINDVRNDRSNLSKDYMGWHFTNMGGEEKLMNKVSSYGHVEYSTPEVKEIIKANMAQNKDYIGRPFTLSTDETEWPEYLKANRDKYKSLLKK